ncbi:MAG: hypothetical protein KF775_18960 [Cyclobacteriaceae bacterium]|nr:hypothetical protein [Cyclobacteriaceae bacterium]
MKKVVAILSLVLFAGAMQTSYASNSVIATEIQNDELVKITIDELPAPVKETLATPAYQNWSIEEAFYNKTKDHYELSVKNGAESKTLKFGKDGKEIK